RVVDVTAELLIETDQADGRVFTDRHVGEAFEHAADAAGAVLIDLRIDTAGETARVGPVGDHADHAGLGAGAEQGALRARQRFHARDVIEVNVEGARARDRRFVEIHARRRVAGAGGDTAEVDVGAA